MKRFCIETDYKVLASYNIDKEIVSVLFDNGESIESEEEAIDRRVETK